MSTMFPSVHHHPPLHLPLKDALTKLILLDKMYASKELTVEQRKEIHSQIQDMLVYLSTAPAHDKADLFARLDFIIRGQNERIFSTVEGDLLTKTLLQLRQDSLYMLP